MCVLYAITYLEATTISLVLDQKVNLSNRLFPCMSMKSGGKVVMSSRASSYPGGLESYKELIHIANSYLASVWPT